MPNHFHFILIQQNDYAITKFMLTLCTSYAKYFNIKHHLIGRLFQERFRSKIVESDEYLLHLSRYIHLNPVASTPGVEANKYLWSSYQEYVNPTKGLCDTSVILGYFSQNNPKSSYRKFVEGGITESESIFDFNPWG
jgi:putative transposase